MERLAAAWSFIIVLGCVVFAKAQVATGEGPMKEDFSGTDTSGLPAGWKVLTGDWSVEAGSLRGSSSDNEARVQLRQILDEAGVL